MSSSAVRRPPEAFEIVPPVATNLTLGGVEDCAQTMPDEVTTATRQHRIPTRSERCMDNSLFRKNSIEESYNNPMLGRSSKRHSIVVSCTAVLACAVLITGCAEGNGAVDIAGAAQQSAPASETTPPGPPTFSREVAPIVWENCAICHRPEGTAPFSLLTYEDVGSHAEAIAIAVEDRHMPPWLPEPGYGSFLGERRLSDRELETILRWVASGAVEGDPAALPESPTFTEGWQLGEPDLVVEMPQAFTLAPAEGDVFRNFVIPTPSDPRRYVHTVELHPGNPKVVHHAVLTVDESTSSRELDRRDPEVGFYSSMDAAGEAHTPAGQFLGWTPGMVPRRGEENLAWGLRGGTDLVLQLHMLPGSEAEDIRSLIGLYFTDRPPQEQAYVVRLGSTDIDVAAGDPAYVIEDSYVLPVDVRVLGIYPHAHYLATDMQGFASLPNGSREWLIWIKEWDFLKQDWYTYTEPVFLPAGTTLTMRFTYDNSRENPRNPNRPPRRVVYGPNSSDEMGDLWIRMLPLVPAELTVLETDFIHKERGKEISRAQRVLAAGPDGALNHYNLAVLLHADGTLEEAESHYRAALQRDPDLADAHTNLAVLLVGRGRNREGADHYRQALRIEPDSADVYLNLARIYLSQSAVTDAITLLLRGIEIDPDMWELHADIAAAHVRQGNPAAAVSSYRTGLAIDPDVAFLHIGLGEVLGAQGRIADAEEQFRIALTIVPQDARAHHDLGMALEQQGRVPEAIESYRRALAIDSALPGAQANLDRALRIRSPH